MSRISPYIGPQTVHYVADPSDPANPIRTEPTTTPDYWCLIVPTAGINIGLHCDEAAIAAIRIALPPIGPDGP